MDIIIHDLIYIKSKNNKTLRFLQKFYLILEINIFKKFNKIYVQSYQEYRIIKKFLPEKKFI